MNERERQDVGERAARFIAFFGGRVRAANEQVRVRPRFGGSATIERAPRHARPDADERGRSGHKRFQAYQEGN